MHRSPAPAGRWPAPAPGPRRLLRTLRGPAALVLTAGLLAGCAGERPTLETGGKKAAAVATSTSAPTTTTIPLTDRPAGPDNMLGYIATPAGTPAVHTEPVATSPTIDIPATTEVGAPTTFAVIGDPGAPTPTTTGWIKVLLPTRPNGATGWVQATSVEVTKTPLRLFIDLAGHKLRVENAGATVFETTVAIGTADNPTPTGPTYVTELIKNTNPGGSYGPYAFGLALHSETLTEFAGGDGQVGVHGTNHPELIGQDVSHGCVRLTNDDITKVVDLALPLGVPVFIS